MNEAINLLSAALTDRYRVIRELGEGGMATVYLAEDVKHRRQVAVKMLRPELAATLGAERFLREIEIAAGLHHPHILPLYDSGGAGGVLFYVMPFVDGPSLRDRATTVGALPIDEAVRIIREVADALAYSHAHGLVHRDIKPENILLSGSHALVADFGVAKALKAATAGNTLTSVGMSLGTPAYMAPEQAMADPAADHRVDIYALGVVAYEILAGRSAFAGTNPQQLIAAHLTQTPDKLSLHRHTVSPALEAIVMRCLEKNADDRWQDAGDIVRALETLPSTSETHAGTHAKSENSTSNPARAQRSNVARVAGIAAVLLALAGAGAWWYTKGAGAGTLIGSAAIAQNDMVLVSDFENRTSDSTLAATITDAVRVDLQQSSVVRVLTQSEMFTGITQMGLSRGKFLPDSQVHELAERQNAKAYIVGDIAKLGSGFQLTARVIATAGGSEPLTVRATANDESALIAAVEKLGHELRRRIGESLRSVNSTPPLAQATTASLPALRLYTAGRRAENEGDRPKAIVLAKQALDIDSTFASAWGLLFTAYINVGSVKLANDAAAHAYAHRERLPEYERLRTEARYARSQNDAAKEEQAYKRMDELGKDQIGYANMLLENRRFAEAEAMAKKGIALSPTQSVGLWNLVEAQIVQRRFDAADSAIAQSPLPNDNTFKMELQGEVLLARRDFDAADKYFNSPAVQKFGSANEYKCALDLARARFTSLRKNCDSPSGPIDILNPFRTSLMLAYVRLAGDTARGRSEYAAFIAEPPDKRNADLYGRMIALVAEVGDVRAAKTLLTDWRRSVDANDLSFRQDSALALGAIAAAEQQWDKAATSFLAWNESPMASSFHFYSRGLAEAGMAIDRLGKPDSAIALLERALSMPSASGIIYETQWYSPALEKLGDLYEARGDRAKAAEYYRRYLDVMKGAEEPVATQVKMVREKYVRLTSEPARPR